MPDGPVHNLRWPAALIVLTLTVAIAGGVRAQTCGGPLPPGAGVTSVNLTPVTLSVLQSSLTPVPTTDGFIHLAYAALMINLGRKPANLAEVVPVDPLNGFRPTGVNKIVDMNGNDIAGTVRLFNPPRAEGVEQSQSFYAKELMGGASGIVFFDVRYRRMEDVPRLLSHRLSITFAESATPLTEETDPIPVSCQSPVVLSPPLVGPRWWNGNGCCGAISPHRSAILPVNGAIKPPEQFAIDYVQLNADNGCCSGPVKDLNSWPFFGAPILAAADGVVVERVDGMPEQVPGEVKGINAQNAAGNHIIEDIGEGRYILYAHMRTGSIPSPIAAGTRLVRGEKIGEVGNTGSSTAPHLHFQVMDRPSTLNSIGLPFVFDRQILEGQVLGAAQQVNDTYEAGGTLTFVEHNATEVNRMPAEGQVFGYNLRQQ